MTDATKTQAAERPGPGTLSIRGDYARITIHSAADIDTAQVTVSDPQKMVVTATGTDLDVDLPHGPAFGNGSSQMIVGNMRGGSMIVGNGTIIQSRGNMSVRQVGNQTWVNGQLIPGTDGTLPSEIVVEARLPLGSSIILNIESGTATVTGGAYKEIRSHGQSLDLEADTAHSLEFDTTSGDLRINDVAHLNARTVSGDIRISKAGTARVSTTSGDIRIRALQTDATAASVSGDIEIHAMTNCLIDARTVSGDIDITAEPGREPKVTHSTMSGRARIPVRKR